jgi:recombination protein RecR
MSPTQKLADLFGEFPGIGPRQAERFVYFLLRKNAAYRRALALALADLGRMVAQCGFCGRHFTAPGGRSDARAGAARLCAICADEGRDRARLMVIEKDVDLENVEKSGGFRGRYFVLGGLIAPPERAPEERIRIRPLCECVRNAAAKDALSEVVLALSPTTSGEHTMHYVRDALQPLAQEYGFRIAALGRGLSTGLELEYSDLETLKHAVENRK